MTIEPVTAPVVVGARDPEMGALLEAAASAGCRERRIQPLGRARNIVELDASGEASKTVAGLRSQGFAAVAGPPGPGYEVVWARRNGPTWYRTGCCVCFPWSPFNRGEAEVMIELDPGSGFGSGHHPTTVLMLRWVAGAELRGASVLDVGCGTGVLGIAAVMAGAERVAAIDTAVAAVTATRANVERNGVGHRFELLDADLASIDDRYDVVLANMHAPVLIDLAPHLRSVARPGASIVLSGLSPAQPSMVAAAMRPLRTVGRSELDDWVALELRRA